MIIIAQSSERSGRPSEAIVPRPSVFIMAIPAPYSIDAAYDEIFAMLNGIGNLVRADGDHPLVSED